MITIPILRFGRFYDSLETDVLADFQSGNALARISRANSGLIVKDLRQASRARQLLLEISPRELIARVTRAGALFMEASLPLGDSNQSPEEFARCQSGTTGLPLRMCQANMAKNHFVLTHMSQILDSLTRGLDLDILSRGYGVESRGLTVSFQARASALGLVLPSNSPGVHALWLPVIPMQIGLMIKPGSQEPWTAYRVAAAFAAAGIPPETIGIYPGGAEVGAEILDRSERALLFGGAETAQRHAGNPRIQVHGPGLSKILIGDDRVDEWREHLDWMIESVLANGGRSCVNCSGIWASRHTEAIAEAIAERLGPIEVKPPEDPAAELAAFTSRERAEAIHAGICEKLREGGVKDFTASFGGRLETKERCAYLRPWVVHCDSPQPGLANSEYLFPFVAVVQCPQNEMLRRIGPTLVATALTDDPAWRRELIDATQIDRLNLGPIPTTKLNWLQPHEGNLVEFLYRSRALQMASSR